MAAGLFDSDLRNLYIIESAFAQAFSKLQTIVRLLLSIETMCLNLTDS